MNQTLSEMKLAELASLYILAMRYPELVNAKPIEIQMAMEALAGNNPTIASIQEQRFSIDFAKS